MGVGSIRAIIIIRIKGISRWMLVACRGHSLGRCRPKGSKRFTLITMRYNKKGLSRILSFPNIWKRNCQPTPLLMKSQQLNIEKRHSIRLFLQVRPKENTVWRKQCCTRKCWKQIWFSAVSRRKTRHRWTDFRIFPSLFTHRIIFP